MKHTITKTLSALAILAAFSIGAAARAETVETRIGKLSFTHDFANQRIEGRVVIAVAIKYE